MGVPELVRLGEFVEPAERLQRDLLPRVAQAAHGGVAHAAHGGAARGGAARGGAPLADRLELRRHGFGPRPPVDDGLLRLLELVLKPQALVLQPDPVLALLVRDK